MTDRDYFAAAPLIRGMGVLGCEQIAKSCYEMAAVMLRERERHHIPDAGKMVKTPTNHDAVPEARAGSDEARTDKAAASHRREGTGNTPSEAEIDALEFVVDAGGIANGWDKDILRQWLMRLRPEFYSAEAIKEGESDRPQPIGSPAKTNPTPMRNGTPAEGSVHGEGTVGQRLVGRLSITQAMLDDNEKLRSEIARLREAIRRLAEQDATLSVCGGNVTVTMDATLATHATPHEGSVQGEGSVLDSRNWKEPVAWAVVYPNDEVAIVAFKRRDADERASASDRVVPLYRSPTLTDEEREAVETADAYMSAAGCHNTNVQKALRKLLERLK